ncbi:thermonuclease family protein [Mesomycoplasma flocculare]|uniref:thermonuclease family protein n=1 Tax=Mesomycoplasma flocculare TaxID=2128 RepID=UPI00136BF1C1|nr:thermonuclease family protein [Mesomycoplasma flocculare]MXR06166.1 hypothetical protein [Mesomycoplasma flocculare]MXR12529.1 hypothetical protein [Mesomycoplasma flocculare]
MKKIFQKLFLGTLNIIIVAFFAISCIVENHKFSYTEAQKYYKIEDFSKNPFEDLQNPQSQYAQNIRKFLDPKYQWKDEEKIKFKNEILPDKTYFEIISAQVEKWTDGDTVTLKALNSDKLPPIFNARLESIDTPEVGKKDGQGNYQKTKGLEGEYAQKAKNFAEKILPNKSIISFLFPKTGAARSYDRYVGSIYFGHDGFFKNYAVEIVKAGLAIPILQSGLAAINNESSIYSYVSIKQAAALENSINKKFGFYENLKDTKFVTITNMIKSVYKARGVGAIDNFLVLGDINKDKNVFDWYEFGLEQKRKQKHEIRNEKNVRK